MSYDEGTGSVGSTIGAPLAFKLLAAAALADEEFLTRLKADPRAAAEEVNVFLSDDDVTFLGTIDWYGLEAALPPVRTALNLGVTEASW